MMAKTDLKRNITGYWVKHCQSLPEDVVWLPCTTKFNTVYVVDTSDAVHGIDWDHDACMCLAAAGSGLVLNRGAISRAIGFSAFGASAFGVVWADLASVVHVPRLVRHNKGRLVGDASKPFAPSTIEDRMDSENAGIVFLD